MYSIMHDPGHGGVDSGATRNGYKEKDLTLKLALDIDKEIQRHNCKSYLTRENDEYVSLEDRSRMANDLNVDMLISYHFNSFTNEFASGTETFHFIGSEKGQKLATKIQNELIKAQLVNIDRGVKSANFSVLRRTKMQSALIEVCFISNKDDLKFFIDNYDKYVQTIARALLEYLGIEYVPLKEEIPPFKPPINTLEDKINITLLSENILVDGFLKEGTNYMNINNSYISIREVLENIGLVVGWDSRRKTVTANIAKDYKVQDENTGLLLLGKEIRMKTYIYKNKHYLKIKDAYIPMRDIFETLGLEVKWDKNMIIVNK